MPRKELHSDKKSLFPNLNYGAKEAYKRLRTNLMCSFEDEESKVIGITSANPSEGKSLSAINMAFCLSEIGKKVLLLDGDMLRPSIHEKLGVTQIPGLTEHLTDMDVTAESIRTCELGEGLKIDIIPSGTKASNTSQLLTSRRMERLLAGLRQSYDYILVDLPPVGSVADVAAVAKKMDGVMIVLREGHCYRSQIRQCVDQLIYAKANIIGFVLNGSRIGSHGYYKYGKYGHYGYYNKGYSYYGKGYYGDYSKEK